MFEGLMIGFGVVFEPYNLFMVAVGAFLGTWVGMLPGLGPAAGIAILLPFTYGMDPAAALIMLCGIYFGAMYGGAISSILINTPGDASAVMTAIDGSQMAQKGRAGAALLISAMSSLVGGMIGLLALSFLAAPIASFALKFGPPEYFAMTTFALTATASLVGGNVLKGLLSLFLGLLIASVGTDLQSGTQRFTLDQPFLMDGIPLLAVIIGIFAISEALFNIERLFMDKSAKFASVGKLWATKAEFLRARWAMVRGALIGFVVGILPGAGGPVATIMAYSNEVRISKKPEEFGRGAVEGVAAPEGANNACVSGALVPLLTLGIPGSGATAILLGGFLLYGLQPGPRFFTDHPDVAWGLIASLYVSNIMLIVFNVPLIGIFTRLLHLPREILSALIMLISLTGAYSVSNSTFDVGLSILFGVLGYVMRKMNVPAAPLILGVVLGGMFEQSLRQSMSLSGGDWTFLVTRPLSGSLLFLSALALFAPVLKRLFLSVRL